MELLFITGEGRSGSTLIERVLAELPGVCALGESTHVWQDSLHERQRCGCGSPFSACEFWTAVGDKAFGGWSNVDRRGIVDLLKTVGYTRHIPRLLRPNSDQLAFIHEFVGYQLRLYQAAAAVSGARVIVDSSKYPALAYLLRFAPGLRLKILHLVRDPRGVAYSWTKQVPRPETDGTTMVPRYQPSRTALRWAVWNGAVHVLARLGGDRPTTAPGTTPIIRVRYEDFVAAPPHVARQLAAFAGLTPTPADFSFLGERHAELGAIHSASGNPMRFMTGHTPLRLDQEWRTRLPARQRRLVTMICLPLLAMYGYPLAPQRLPSG